MNPLVRLAPAKVNLYLKIIRKREDGYHDLATLMQRISLYDKLIFKPANEGVVLHCPHTNLPEDSNNIVYRTAAIFLRRVPFTDGIDITINKSIPVAAGLGGGSSNAA
ncbi:MAG: hypothetical protein M0P16_11995, partial [Syntrophales bacterium]|nr:hypothetical protein [Syntrophales bacterium]